MSIAERHHNDAGHHAITDELANWVAGFDAKDMSPAATVWAKHALLDWFGVTIAGAGEPLVDILSAEYAAEKGGACTVVGRATRATEANAALINGSASHALDYDDVNKRLHGHPTVTVAPAVLALGETLRASGRDVLAALVVGTEVECLIGEMAGHGHYEAGYHATGTIGTIGAAAAAAKMLGLDADAVRHALGIAASEAAGLKSNFGTMTKPLHAGKAAMNGLMAARLASRGFTANTAIVEAPQGLADVMMPGFVGAEAQPHPPGYLSIQQTLFKYHAACYLIHASIEAIKALRADYAIGLDDLKSMTLHVNPGHLTVCNIPEPTTGLEIKFSIRHCAAMALDGIDTGALATYSDANAVDPRYAAARAKINLATHEEMDRMQARVVIDLADGRQIEAAHDVGVPAGDTDAQWQKLTAKFESLCVPVIGEARTASIIEGVAGIDNAQAVMKLMDAAK